MADVNANINIDINSAQALSELRRLQGQITAFNESLIASNVAAAASQRQLNSQLIQQVSAVKGFTTSISNVESSMHRLGTAIEKNKLSMGQYFKYAVASSNNFGRVFQTQHNEVMDLAADRVKRLQTQYVALGQSQNGVTRALAARPLNLFNADAAIATQRQMLFNKLIRDGSTSLVNWGKNTQWAGRQLMVGFTVPITIFGATAGKIFADLEKQAINFKRVYGDLNTPSSETEGMIKQIQTLGKEYTKYGIAVSDTIGLAAKAAAMGAQGADLLAATEQATRLATLGQIDQNQALTATISLQSAFKISSEELAGAIDFLNAVENQTVTSLDDITVAIPKVAPIIKGLGGDVKDLALFMTAMREGGVNAAEGANALKSGLASLINPTKAAREQLAAVGINIDQILSRNKGDLRGLVMDFATALESVDNFGRQQTLAKVFGKYQFARMGALFANINKDGSQAQRVLDLTGRSMEELAQLSEKELGNIEGAISVKFTAAVEKLKLAIAPIGEMFLKIATPIVEIVTKIAEAFDKLPDGIKTFITYAAGIGAVVIPSVIMLVGLLGNFIGNMMKVGIGFRNIMAKATGTADSFQWLAMTELDAMAAAASLEGATNSLTGSLNVQESSVNNLASAYGRMAAAANTAAANMPQAMRMPMAGGANPKRMARGGIVPGRGNTDSVPALLMPGETVVTKEATSKFAPILAAMNAGTIKGLAEGEVQVGIPGSWEAAHFGGQGSMTGQELLDWAEGKSQATRERIAALVESVEDGVNRVFTTLDNRVVGLSREVNQAVGETGSGKTVAASLARRDLVDRGDIAHIELVRQLKAAKVPVEEIRGIIGRVTSEITTGFDDLGDVATVTAEDIDRITDQAYRRVAATDERVDAAYTRMSQPTTVVDPTARGGRQNRVNLADTYKTKRGTYNRQMGEVATGPIPYNPKGAIKITQSIADELGVTTREAAAAFNGLSNTVKTRLADIVGDVRGFANVMRTELHMAGMTMADAALEGQRQGFQTGSPSRAAADIGDEVPRGTAVGIERSTPVAVAAAEEMGSQVQKQLMMNFEEEQALFDAAPYAGQRTMVPTRTPVTYGQLAAAEEEAYRMNAQRQLDMDHETALQIDSIRNLTDEMNSGATEQRKINPWYKKLGGALKNGSMKMQGAMFAMDGMVFGMSMLDNQIGQFAQKIMPAVFAMQGITMLLPALTSPIGLAVAGAAGLAGAFIYTRTTLDNLAREAAKAGSSLGQFAGSKSIISEATGFQFPNAQDRLFRFSKEDRQAMSEFSNFFSGEKGSAFIEELKSLNNEDRQKKIRFMLAQAVGSGMDPKKAKAFGQAIADQLGDALLNSSIARDFANQVYKSGSQALIDLEKERQGLMPQIGPGDRPDYTSGVNVLSKPYELTGAGAENPWAAGAKTGGMVMGAGALAALAMSATGIGAVAAPFVLLGSLVAGIGAAAIGTAQAFAEQKDATEKAAKALGFSLQTTENLANIEAVLENERAQGLIKYEEYAKRRAELDKQQADQAEYVKQALSIGADAGALTQAFGNQLTLQGFSADQAGVISEQFNANALSQRFFQKDFTALDKEQQDYVTKVFEKVMTGITPENAAQRLTDVETTWSNIAQSMVDAMKTGAGNVNFDQAFNKENYSAWLQTSMKEGLSQPLMDYNPDALANNLASMDMELKKVKSSANEVQIALNGFADQDFAVQILASTDSIKGFGQMLAKIGDFKGLNIERTWKAVSDAVKAGDFKTTADATAAIVKNIERMSKIKFKKDGFFTDPKMFMPDPQTFTDAMLAMGKKINEIPGLWKNAVNEADKILDKFGKDALNKMGKIKPKILPQILANVLGTTVDNATGIANTLNAAFPDSLSPVQLSILVSLAGDNAALALLKNPRAMEAAASGQTSWEEPVQGPFAPGVERPTVTMQVPPWLSMFAGANTQGYTPPGATDKNGSGGATKEDPYGDWWKALGEKLRIFTNINSVMDKLVKEKDKWEKALPKLQYKDSLVDQMRKAGLSEAMIADLLSKGYAAAKKIFDTLKEKGKLKVADLGFQIATVANMTSDAVGAGTLDRQRVTAYNNLRQNTNLSQEEIMSTMEDPAAVAFFANIKNKGTKAWSDYVTKVQDATAAHKEWLATSDPLTAALDKQAQTMSRVNAEFDYQYAKIDVSKNAEFAAAYGMTADEMRIQINERQDLIDGYQQEISAIEDSIKVIERRKGVDSDISTWGTERLQKHREELQKEIDALERLNELDQRRIEKIRREDEIRQRTSSSYQHDLEIMSQQEDKIRSTYDDRINALNKIAEINQYIIDQQRQQVGLSQALSQGDIYAATQAAQEMRAAQAQQAADNARAGLEAGRDNAIAGVTNAEGLTRAQIEEKINQIKEQSYQSSLLIRNIEDEIYERNKDILSYKDRQWWVDQALDKVNGEIAAKQQLILDIERSKIEPAQAWVDKHQEYLDDLNDSITNEQGRVTVLGQTRDQWSRIDAFVVASLTYQDSLSKRTVEAEQNAAALAAQWGVVGQNIANAYNAMSTGVMEIMSKPLTATYTAADRDAEIAALQARYQGQMTAAFSGLGIDLGTFAATGQPIPVSVGTNGNLISFDPEKNYNKLVNERMNLAQERWNMNQYKEARDYLNAAKQYLPFVKDKDIIHRYQNFDATLQAIGFATGGMVSGRSGIDKIPAMLSSGEFVIRKAMVDKYGESFLAAINQGAFSMPRYGFSNAMATAKPSSGKVVEMNAPVYNSYNVSVNANTNASADEIASLTMTKLRNMQNMQVRSARAK